MIASINSHFCLCCSAFIHPFICLSLSSFFFLPLFIHLSRSSAFLSKLFERLAPDLHSSIVSIRHEYIQRCFTHMQGFIDASNTAGIERCLVLLNNLLDSSEKMGLGQSQNSCLFVVVVFLLFAALFLRLFHFLPLSLLIFMLHFRLSFFPASFSSSSCFSSSHCPLPSQVVFVLTALNFVVPRLISPSPISSLEKPKGKGSL